MTRLVLSACDLQIGFQPSRVSRKVVASGLNLDLHGGEFVCLAGPNGVGKSTLLRTLTRLQPALGGEVRLSGRPLREYSSKELAGLVSVVLTGQVEVNAMRVRELVGLGRFPHTGIFDSRSQEDERAVENALALTDVSQLADRFVQELSDGERQRVMIARALAQEPLLLVLDEPTAFLDLPGRISIMHLLRDLARGRGQAVLTSTHDLDLAMRSADRIWLMNRGGSIAQGSPEDLVLSGQFGHTFSQANLRYNMSTGQFEEEHAGARPVVLRAEGLAGAWTAHALRRAGFEVLVEGAEYLPLIEVEGQGGANCWRLTWQGVSRELSSIYALLSALLE
ncbi:MAG TPA: ABC transporter ATP-binding protein [Anaerolineaceae bacterium]|jgi:iron complex transport system ATP-binding protein|nr:ABC transporter ATP-binding protein [Anaerolineaceae bacterium]HPS33090.1 ABC transporter ATP-binding protein [Anaerolineaceae bacterium]